MRRFLQRLLMPIALVAVTQTTIVSAESIRLTGPNGEIQSSPQFSEQITRRASSASEPSRFYGPTSGQETLWSVASQLRPSNQVSVQQTLLAIYQLNPQAFENQNIHTLIPGSTLRIPSLAQARSVSTDEAVRIMNLHQARLDGNAPAPASALPAKPQPVATPAPTVVEKPQLPNRTPAITKPAVEPKPVTPAAKPKEVVNLEQQLQSSESELAALEEKNHRLRLMLADVQTEVDGLKQELGDENRIRSEVEKLLEAERLRLAEESRNAPSTMDKILSNGWLVGAMAVIPALLIGLVVMTLLGRKKDESEQANSDELQSSPNAPIAPVVPDTLDQDVEDELDLDDDLFGESSDDDLLFSAELDGEPSKDDDLDVFADLDDNDLDFNLENDDEDPFAAINEDGVLDESIASPGISSNGISVDAEEKALGLEEMERALDDVIIEDDLSDDEFDLSDSPVGQDDIDDLFNSAQKDVELDDALDQTMLDELLSGDVEIEDDGSELDFDNLLAEASDEIEAEKDPAESDAFNVTSDDEIDALFAQVESQATEPDQDAIRQLEQESTALFDELLASDEDTQQPLAQSGELDDLLDSGKDEFDLSSDDDDVALLDEWLDDSDDDSLETIDADSTAMLDELLDGDDEQAEQDEFDLESTALLDELLDDDTSDDASPEMEKPQSDFASELNSLTAESDSAEAEDDAFDIDSIDLLDEMLDDDDESITQSPYDQDSTDLLDELFKDDDSEDDLSIGDDGTELFEELLEIEKGEPQAETNSAFDIDQLLDDVQSELPQSDSEDLLDRKSVV